MVTIASLGTAILISAAVVWIVSFIVWTALPHHKSDYKGLPNEKAVIKALKTQRLAPGQYDIPHLASRSELKKPEVSKLYREGPTGFLTIMPRGFPALGKSMALSFAYYLLVSTAVAFVAAWTLPPAAEYLTVFRVTGLVAWLAYATAIVPDALWFGRSWATIAKHFADALVYGLLTAGVFGWQWPS